MANISMFGSIMQKLTDIVVGFFAIIPQTVYFIYTSVASLLDMFQFVIRKLAGLDVYYVSTSTGLEEKTGDIVTELIEGILGINNRYSALNTVFWSMIVFGLIVLFVMSIITIIKAHYNYDAKKSQPSYIIKSALKSIALMAIIPVTVLLGLYLNSAIFQTLDTITTPASDSEISGRFEDEAVGQLASATKNSTKVYSSYDFFGEKEWSNTTSFSGVLFNICAHDANRIRYGAYTIGSGQWDDAGIFYLNDAGSMSEEDAKEKVAQQIDFAFENNLTLISSRTISISGGESVSAIGSSLIFAPSAAYAAGLINVSHFSKYNVGLVWYYYNLWSFNYIIAFAGVSICLALFANLIFGLLLRILIMSILFIAYPPIVGITPLDGGNGVKSWRNNVMTYAISSYATVVSMNLFFMVLPLVRSISYFNSPFLDGIVSMIIMIAGLTMVGKFSTMVSGFVGAKNIDEMGQGVRKDTSKPVAQGVSNLVKMGGAALTPLAITRKISNERHAVAEKTRNQRIYQLRKKEKIGKLTAKEFNQLQQLEYEKELQEKRKLKAKVAKIGTGMLKKVKSSKALKAAGKLYDKDLTRIVLGLAGIPVSSIPEKAWVDQAVLDEDGNVILDENGDPVTEKVIYAKNADGSPALDEKGNPIVVKKKGSRWAEIKDAIVDLTGTTFKVVGDVSGIKRVIDSQSGAIDSAKTKLNELTEGLATLGGKKTLFKTKKMEDSEKEEGELSESTLDMQQSIDSSAKAMKEIKDVLSKISNKKLNS